LLVKLLNCSNHTKQIADSGPVGPVAADRREYWGSENMGRDGGECGRGWALSAIGGPGVLKVNVKPTFDCRA